MKILTEMLLTAFLIFAALTPAMSTTYTTKYFEENQVYKCCSAPRKDLMVYCYKGKLTSHLHLWETVQLHFSMSPDKYTHYVASTPEGVVTKYESDISSWAVNLFFRKKSIKLDPFNTTCVGIVTSENYDVRLHRIRVDYWRVLMMGFGAILFVAAPKLSRNSLFYYLTGMSVGTFASVLILVYIFSRFLPRSNYLATKLRRNFCKKFITLPTGAIKMFFPNWPKKPVMYSFLAGGWTVGVYVAQMVWENIRVILEGYKIYVLYYALVTGILSFFVCYRIGPVSDPRSMDLIKWTLQAVALTLIYCSTHCQSAGVALALVVVCVRGLPLKKIFRPLQSLKRWWKQEPPKLLTEEEYYQQGAEETRKALDELRGYCSSPECNQWKTVLRLKNPIRFAKFIEGSSHLEDGEVLAFETGSNKSNDGEDMLTDDSSDE